MEFFNDYIMFRLFFDDNRFVPGSRRRYPPSSAINAPAGNYPLRRESNVETGSRRLSILRSTSATGSSTWRGSCLDVSQANLRLPIRQRLMRRRSGSWSGPPSASSSHHLLPIDEEENPDKHGTHNSKGSARFSKSERKWGSLDVPPEIHVTKAEEEQDSFSAHKYTEPTSVSAQEVNYHHPTQAVSAVLRIKQRLSRKRSGSLPEARLTDREGNFLDCPEARTEPSTIGFVTPPAPPSVSPSPSGQRKKLVRRSTGSLTMSGALTPRSVAGASTLTLSPIASPAPSPMPSPCLSSSDIGSSPAFPFSPATPSQHHLDYSPDEICQRKPSKLLKCSLILLDSYLKGVKQPNAEKASDDDLEDQFSKNKFAKLERNKGLPNDPPVGNLIRLSLSSSEEKLTDSKTMLNTPDRSFALFHKAASTSFDSNSVTNSPQEKHSRRGYSLWAPVFATMASKMKRLRPRVATSQCKLAMPTINRLQESESESSRKSSAPMPSHRRSILIQSRSKSHPSEESRATFVRYLSKSVVDKSKRKSRQHTEQRSSLVAELIQLGDNHPESVLQKPPIQPLILDLRKSEEHVDEKGSIDFSSKMDEQLLDSWCSETEQKFQHSSCDEQTTVKVNTIVQGKKRGRRGKLSITLNYSQAIGYLTFSINKAKHLHRNSNVFVRIMHFESGVLAETKTTCATVPCGKTKVNLKEAYMFGIEPIRLPETHFVAEVWDNSTGGDPPHQAGHVVIGPDADGAGCSHWQRMCKYPNFPCRVWHSLVIS